MKRESYSYMYPGPAEEAAQAQPEALAAPETTEAGGFTFTLPIVALDAGYTCAAFSARKQVGYPRTLVFRADSLPLEAWREEYLHTVETLGLADGEYTCAVLLEGAGRGSVFRVCGQPPAGEVCAKARLYELAPVADRMTRTFRAKTRLENGELAVLPLGSSLAGTLESASPSAVFLPRTAIAGAGEARFVWIVDRDSRVRRRHVAAVREVSPNLAAVEGVDPGDKVVTAGIAALEEGQKVRTPDAERELLPR